MAMHHRTGAVRVQVFQVRAGYARRPHVTGLQRIACVVTGHRPVEVERDRWECRRCHQTRQLF